MKTKNGPYVYKEDMEYLLLEKDYEIAYLRNHISELNLALIDREKILLRSMIVATKYRDLLDGFHEKFTHLIQIGG